MKYQEIYHIDDKTYFVKMKNHRINLYEKRKQFLFSHKYLVASSSFNVFKGNPKTNKHIEQLILNWHETGQFCLP